MKKITMSMVLTFVFFVFAAPLWAESYLVGQAGLFNPEEGVLDDGYNLEVAYGISLVDVFPGLASKDSAWKKVTAELGIGYRHADGQESVSTFGSTITTKLDLDVIPITLTAVYTHEIAGTPLKLYGGAGPGIYYATADSKVTTTVPGLGSVTVSDDDSEFKLGLVLKGGVLFSLNRRLDLSGGMQLDLVSDDVGGFIVNFGVRYYF